jgi:hypothetical protein
MTDPLDDLFHGCALQAFLEQAAIERNWPDMAATRLRAFDLYEQALAAQSRLRAQIDKARSASATPSPLGKTAVSS